MKMRMPSVPLFTVDPYFSVWTTESVQQKYPTHWTGAQNAMRGVLTVDGADYRFLGAGSEPPLPQTALEADATATYIQYEGAGIRLYATFLSPLLADNLYYASRPVCYLHLTYEATDGAAHTVCARLTVGEELVLNRAGEGRALAEPLCAEGLCGMKMGKGNQTVLSRSGDDVRIDWGYLLLAVHGQGERGVQLLDDLYAVYAQGALTPSLLFLIGYDDVRSIRYFDEELPAYWKRDGKTIEEAMREAAEEYETLARTCRAFGMRLREQATACGGEEYAELLLLAYRQAMAAHKAVADRDGQLLYISKECFSNGCAATVDVTYPSAPMFLYYNPELLKGMLRPVFRFARSDKWKWDFAPHDVGVYPFVQGQAYGDQPQQQMPVEECGNILILVSAVCRREGDYTFARENMDLLRKWVTYLEQNGEDPGEQLCTDDFAGHMAHNVNLSVKALMGLEGFSDILRALGDHKEAARLHAAAQAGAASVYRRAVQEDGCTRLAFDRADTFSLKYNAVWDRLWHTDLFEPAFFQGEIARYKKEALPYGVPLDSRETYTKPEWQLFAACFAHTREDFEFFVHLVHRAYHTMHTRVPMGDWYYADTSDAIMFRHRSPVGGLFIRLLFDK